MAERVIQVLEVADDSLADLPARVAGCVLIALGSSAGKREDPEGMAVNPQLIRRVSPSYQVAHQKLEGSG